MAAVNEDSLFQKALDYLKSDDWQTRDAGASILTGLINKDSTEIIAILINALQDEIDNPLSLKGAAGTYTTINEYLKNHYCQELIKLGPVTGREIIKRLDSVKGELKSRLIIILGFLGEKAYRDKIRKIYYDSNDGYLRLFALRGLMMFKDNEDIPLFKDALEDDFQAFNNSDVIPRRKNVYIIRMDAAGALGMRGYKLKAEGHSYIITAEPDSESSH